MTEKKVDDRLAKLEAEVKAELAKTKPTKKTKTIKSEKGDKEMKTKLKTIAKYAVTVLVTLGVVYAGYWLYTQGYSNGVNDQKQVRAEIKAEVAKLSKQ